MARQWTKSVSLGNRLSTNREYTVHYHYLMERKGTTMRPVLVTGNLCAGNVTTTPVCRAGGSKFLSSDTVNCRRIEKCTQAYTYVYTLIQRDRALPGLIGDSRTAQGLLLLNFECLKGSGSFYL